MADELDALDDAYELPEHVTCPRLRRLYEVLIHRMREEAKHLPMNTVQQLLIERIAYNYIILRWKERGESGGFGSASVQKEFNVFWLSMTQEFNRMLGKVEPVAVSDRKALLRDIQKLIVSTVQSVVPDPKSRKALLEQFAVGFEKAGI